MDVVTKSYTRGRAAPSTGISIGIGPIPAFLVVSGSVKYVVQVPNYIVGMSYLLLKFSKHQ